MEPENQQQTLPSEQSTSIHHHYARPLGLFFVIIALVAGVGMGAQLGYQLRDVRDSMMPTDTQSPGDEGIVCTADAKLCDDGSYVGRTGENCEFVCPEKGVATDGGQQKEVSSLGAEQALNPTVCDRGECKNEKYGFQFSLPGSFEFLKEVDAVYSLNSIYAAGTKSVDYPRAGDGGVLLTIRVSKDEDELSIDEYLEGGRNVVITESSITIAGVQAIQHTKKIADTCGIVTYLSVNGRSTFIEMTGGNSGCQRVESLKSEYDALLNSFVVFSPIYERNLDLDVVTNRVTGKSIYTNHTYGFQIEYPSDSQIKEHFDFAYPHAILLFYEGGQDYTHVINVWDTEAEFKRENRSEASLQRIGDKYISVHGKQNISLRPMY
jgi:hypothetical protein